MSIDFTDVAFEKGLYSDTFLSSIADVIRLCADWAKKHPGQFTVNIDEITNEWSVTCTEAVEYVNRVFLKRHNDPEFTASVWRAMYYEVPEKLVLKSWFSSAAYVAIFRRTASQQRICITAFISMKCVENGWFSEIDIPDDPLYKAPPSLLNLQRVQLDVNNTFLLAYLAKITMAKRPFTVEEICEFGCGSTFLMYHKQPLVEVMLPLSDSDKYTVMTAGALPQKFETKHIALMEMADMRLQKEKYIQYYVTERGPSMIGDIFESVMLKSSCKFISEIPTEDPSEYHHFWRRKF